MSLRNIEQNDLEQILSWRNSDAVRLNMFSQSPIELEQHYEWFKRIQSDDSSVWWIYTDISGVASGVVYFTDINIYSGTSFWGFYVDPKAGKGTGSRMGREALDKAFKDLRIRKVYGDVLEFNIPSQKFHEKLGFMKEGFMREHHRLENRYYDVLRYGLLRSEWCLYGRE